MDAATIFRHCAWILVNILWFTCLKQDFGFYYAKIDLCQKERDLLIDYRIDWNGRSLI